MITTATVLYGVDSEEQLIKWVLSRKTTRLAIRALGLKTLPDAVNFVDNGAVPAVAIVNEGRWIASCPSEGCNSAIDLVKGAGFLCPFCLNVEIKHFIRPVSWPDDIGEIERLLDVRLFRTQRNWAPPETLADLDAENLEHIPGYVSEIARVA